MAQEEKLSGYRWMILFVVCLICFMANFMQYQVSAWGVVVMTTLGIDARWAYQSHVDADAHRCVFVDSCRISC